MKRKIEDKQSNYHLQRTSMDSEIPPSGRANDQAATEKPPATASPSLSKHKQAQLFRACREGDLETVKSLLESGKFSASEQDADGNGSSPLIEAAGAGHLSVCRHLIERGAPWNAVDKNGRCAGNHASDTGFQNVVDYLVEIAVTAELLLGASIRTEMSSSGGSGVASGAGPVEQEPCTKPDYLSTDVRYDNDVLLDRDGDAVMMEWERPLMDAHASIIAGRGGQTVMNVGFGMGIIDSILQEKHSPKLHVIIEAHPGVLAKMDSEGWGSKKKGVRVVRGKWQDEIPKLVEEGIKFDGIFFDTYGEHFTDLENFHNLLPQILKKASGVYSFFNGLAPDNIFFHGVACQCVKLQLGGIGLDTEFASCEMEVSDETWKGVRRKYWHNGTYYLPICTWRTTDRRA